MPLDFASAAQLFMGSEDELARGLGISVADLRALRTTPDRAPAKLVAQLGALLQERGRGMVRVGEMLQDRDRA